MSAPYGFTPPGPTPPTPAPKTSRNPAAPGSGPQTSAFPRSPPPVQAAAARQGRRASRSCFPVRGRGGPGDSRSQEVRGGALREGAGLGQGVGLGRKDRGERTYGLGGLIPGARK